MYLILMDQDQELRGMYKGAIIIIDNVPWYVTGLHEAKPTLFETEKEAQKAISKLKKSKPDAEFEVVDTEWYLYTIGSVENEWVKELADEG